MALTEDQRAMLQLLLEGDQSYADIASLLGADEDEVRSRARAALTEIGGADPDREVGLSDYLLGQADPIGRADAARHLKEDPEDHALAEKLSAQLRLVAPGAELPKLPAAPKPSRKAAQRTKPAAADEAEPDAETAAAPKERRTRTLPSIKRPRIPTPTAPSSLSQNQSRVFAALAAGAVILVAVVLAVAGVFSSDDASSSATTTSADTADDEELARIPLTPVGSGSDSASGEILIGLATADQPFLDVSVEGLDPISGGERYYLWLLFGRDLGFPITPIEIGENGSFSERLAIPSELAPTVSLLQGMEVTLTDDKSVAKAFQQLQQAQSAQGSQDFEEAIPETTGEPVLRGVVPTGNEGQ